MKLQVHSWRWLRLTLKLISSQPILLELYHWSNCKQNLCQYKEIFWKYWDQIITKLFKTVISGIKSIQVVDVTTNFLKIIGLAAHTLLWEKVAWPVEVGVCQADYGAWGSWREKHCSAVLLRMHEVLVGTLKIMWLRINYYVCYYVERFVIYDVTWSVNLNLIVTIKCFHFSY